MKPPADHSIFEHMKHNMTDLKEFLNEKVLQYNNPGFIKRDPVYIPHLYAAKEDIEISGFLTAVISWGNRTSIQKSARRMMEQMGNSPYDFIISHKERDLKQLEGFIHRTFNETDLFTFIMALKHLYQNRNGLEGIFTRYQSEDSLQPAIHHLKREFFQVPHLHRTRKHLPDPFNGSAAKRINMFLRIIKVA